MTLDQWLVTAAGLVIVVFIIWFFWYRTVAATAAVITGDRQEALIIVRGGYTPDTIVVEKGRPVRLSFRREETASCSEMVVFQDFDKSAKLPTGETVAIDLLPEKTGEYEFTCQMGMLRGKLIVT